MNTGIFSRLLAKSPARAAATQTFLAASPRAVGVSGEYWSDCAISPGSPLLEDPVLARRLWEVSDEIVGRASSPGMHTLLRAA